jgi:hypothetical protein
MHLEFYRSLRSLRVFLGVVSASPTATGKRYSFARTLALLIVLMIVHADGTSILSLHNTSLLYKSKLKEALFQL